MISVTFGKMVLRQKFQTLCHKNHLRYGTRSGNVFHTSVRKNLIFE